MGPVRVHRWLILGTALGALVAAAAPLSAARATGPIAIDGVLDEAAWAAAPVFDGFKENFPTFGAEPDLRTEVRVLFDDTALLVGIRCFDPHPELITRSLGRRDAAPPADVVQIAIDASGDHRTAFDFIVNAAGVQRDVMLYADFNATDTWDAVWDSEVKVDEKGWTVELRIPLRILRITRQPAWRAVVRRNVNRTHQIFDSAPIPREANPANVGALIVSRFGPLEGMGDLNPTPDVELTPYVAGKLALRPQFSDGTLPTSRLWDPSADLGLDLKWALTPRLSLSAAINPDFGQVEADQVIQNLTTAEAFFPEKRPFFLQGLDVFQPVGAESGAPHQLFYSRRIGLRDPILGAVKVTGALTDSLDIGVLDAVTLGAANPSLQPLAFKDLADSEPVGLSAADQALLHQLEEVPDRRLQFHPATPFHFGLNDALPADRPTPRNFFAAVARARVGEASSVGATVTASTPLAPRCTPADFRTLEAFATAGCQARGQEALALDWNLRTASGEWGFLGQVEGTVQEGGDAAGRLLADGLRLKGGDFGYGGYLKGGKVGGEGFRFDVTYVHASPLLDLNAMGFQAKNNMQWLDPALHYTRANGWGPFRYVFLDLWADLNWTTDGRWLPRGVNAYAHAEVQLQGYEVVGFQLNWEDRQYDTREIFQAGVPFQRVPAASVTLFAQSNDNQPFFIYGDVFGVHWLPLGPQPGTWGGGADLTLRWQPIDALETRLDASAGYRPLGARYLDTVGSDWLFGSQTATNLSVTLRQQVVFTPRLSLQLYAQLFAGSLQYDRYWTAPVSNRPFLPAGEISPTTGAGVYDAHGAALNLNLVLRWEYRPGSVLFLVYSRSQQEAGSQPVSRSFFPSRLFQGPATDTFLVKLTSWWNT